MCINIGKMNMNQSEKPTVSIIMGVYNAQEFLNRAIDSILSQTYKDWEFIICDDGSTDNTPAILQQYDDPRIRVIRSEKNKGLAEALNLCINASEGSYLARQDADDFSDFDRLRVQVEFMKSHPEVDILGCSVHLINEDNHVWGYRPSSKDFSLDEWLRDVQIIHPTVMMKKEIMLKVGKYDPSAIRVEDYELWMRMILHRVNFFNLDQPLYFYRLGRSDYKKRKVKNRIKAVQVRLKYLPKFDYPLCGYLYICKTLIAIIIPKYFLYLLHRRRFAFSKIPLV